MDTLSHIRTDFLEASLSVGIAGASSVLLLLLRLTILWAPVGAIESFETWFTVMADDTAATVDEFTDAVDTLVGAVSEADVSSVLGVGNGIFSM